jgi:hypothetical protein
MLRDLKSGRIDGLLPECWDPAPFPPEDAY